MEIQIDNFGASIIITSRITFNLPEHQYSDLILEKCPPNLGLGDKWLLCYHALKTYIEPDEAKELIALGCCKVR